MATPVEREAREIPIDILGLLNKLSFLKNSMKRRPENCVSDKFYITSSAKYSISHLEIDEILNTPTGAQGNTEFIVGEDYLEYKEQIAVKKATEKPLPRSNGQRITPKDTPPTTEHIEDVDQDK
ncbi:uncharacterized protein PAC_00755 [Phialocephala subalpina]|uniref:Uncharacterized protein n=1 Tax=Phialocephala subalpina TaxID=576137 RepID=A0A1L7WDM4_9HELO|nr:uncharacterized protein PAC_00755 [Phialocephala subalpina]